MALVRYANKLVDSVGNPGAGTRRASAAVNANRSTMAIPTTGPVIGHETGYYRELVTDLPYRDRSGAGQPTESVPLIIGIRCCRVATTSPSNEYDTASSVDQAVKVTENNVRRSLVTPKPTAGAFASAEYSASWNNP
jgi:hypothetical protein